MLYRLGTEEVGLHTNFLGTLATLLFDAEEAQNAAMNEVRTNAQRISALEEDRQWLWYQIKEIRGKGGNQEKKIGIMLEEYNKTKAVVESVVGEQQKRRVHDMEERSARLKRTMERRLARVAAARKKLLNGIQQMNIQQDKDFATYQQANETSEQELLEMRLKTLASISTFATLAPPLPPGASRTALVELYEATMSDSVQAKGIQANEDLLSLEESCRAQLLQIRGDIRDFSILIRLAESSYLALDDECTQLFGSSSGDSMSGFMNKTTVADEAALERGTKQFWKTTNQLELLDALQALNSRPFITSVTEDLGEFSVEFLKSGSNGGHKDDSRLSLTGESTENLKQGLLDRFDTNIRQVTEDLEDARLKAQLQMQNRLAARAARRQKASTEASNKGSTQTGRAELEAEWRAKKRAFMEQLLKRRTEERLIGRARQGDVDLRKAMELRQDQELDDLAALHLQEKVAVVLLERDIKKAELEAAHGVGELRDGTPDETEAETTARLASLEEANQGIEVSLREYLDLVMRRVSEEHTVEYDRLKCEHADQMREQFHYSEDDSRFTKLADILDCNARVNARLKEIELEQANNMQQKMEEIKRELTYGAANRRQQKTSGEDAAQQDRQRANEWRANMASKRVQSLGRRSQLRASGAHTDALLTLLRQKMDRLWEALEEERVRQQTELAMKVKQKQVARMAKFGDIQGHQQEKRNKRLTARVNRLKDIAEKRTLWKQQKQKGNPERQFSPLVQHIIEEELLSESLRQFKEENVVQFRGRFMRLLGQLELSLRGAVLPSFLAELHSVGKCTACTSQLVRDATIAGRGQNNRMKAAASESNLTSVSSRSSSVDRGNSDGYSSDHSAGGENSNSESVSGGSTSSESSSDNSSSSERSSDNSSSSESSSDNSSSSESSSDSSSSSESSSGTGSNSGSSSSGHSSSSTSSNGESDVSGHEDGGSTSSDEDNSGNRSSTSTTSKRRDSRSSS
ncbi:hypothetical protein TGRUB_235190 [Toxoplasma gondii RUB]|uniref:Uncharacterized protein n=1 Tax=Toxoplasma gondii RUB TaxID=935652 RepID=A0A086LN02_TOXGO|nr:hypothetical protein TGRUB_235190 [Toxoplasma gondii RUB]